MLSVSILLYGVITTLQLLLHQTLQTCTTAQAHFPKIVGGTQGHTYFSQIDYNQMVDYLVTAGHSFDQGVRGDALGSSPWRPLIIAYEFSSYKWGKVFTSLVNQFMAAVQINRLGTRVIVSASSSPRYLIIMDITNGNVITATQFSALDMLDRNCRQLMLLDGGSILTADGTRIIKIIPPSTTTPLYSLSGYSTVKLQSNTAQSYLHVFSHASLICMITVMDMATFTRIYQYQMQCVATLPTLLAETFQSCIYETSSNVDTIIFQESTRFFRISNQYSPPVFTTSTLHQPAAPSLQAKGLHCESNDLVYSLFYGTYSANSNRIFVALVKVNGFRCNSRCYNIGQLILFGCILITQPRPVLPLIYPLRCLRLQISLPLNLKVYMWLTAICSCLLDLTITQTCHRPRQQLLSLMRLSKAPHQFQQRPSQLPKRFQLTLYIHTLCIASAGQLTLSLQLLRQGILLFLLFLLLERLLRLLQQRGNCKIAKQQKPPLLSLVKLIRPHHLILLQEMHCLMSQRKGEKLQSIPYQILSTLTPDKLFLSPQLMAAVLPFLHSLISQTSHIQTQKFRQQQVLLSIHIKFQCSLMMELHLLCTPQILQQQPRRS
ncbi:hypothetical protein FGO68_gene6799 [Halteria grandinella]|uniref:Uncharacterized protein n=1 Tax=Halteria grandinella TaxID=5974 RepID=A0A8J8P5U6_HALGN|nr:hypothetical protein FGO68_gene6799 [Halteria grandinella]